MFETNISTWFDSSFELNSWMPLENIPIQCLIMLIKWSTKKGDFFYRFSMKYLAVGCCCHVTKTMEKEEKTNRFYILIWFLCWCNCVSCDQCAVIWPFFFIIFTKTFRIFIVEFDQLDISSLYIKYFKLLNGDE